jgi:hypothetical protein
MKRDFWAFLLFFLGGTIFLTPNFYYHDQVNVVESSYYRLWERTYERVVVARLAKSQQDGIFSAGGLLGLADVEGEWDFDPDHQYEVYNSGKGFDSYIPYESNPGIQGIVFSIVDLITERTPEQTIVMFRVTVAFLSALVVAFLSACIAIEFSWLSAVLILVFSVLSEWIILPAGNLYWNLWAFYLPFATTMLMLHKASKSGNYASSKILLALFITTLAKVLFTGFEMITTTLIMTTVPFVFYAIRDKWQTKMFIERMIKAGIVLAMATVAGLSILILQIGIVEGSTKGAADYIKDTLDRRAFGDPDEYKKGSKKAYLDSISAKKSDVILTYLKINAFNTQTKPAIWQLPYWQMISLFAIFTLLFLIKHRNGFHEENSRKGKALVLATWYSMAAPLSWLIIFTPTSFIHTFLFPMAWQMPFILLGLALCGYVFLDLFRFKIQ